jgi:cardiolipin hydrolase
MTMSQEIIRDALETTFLDYRLTRGERKGLSRLITSHASSQSDRDFIRARSFEMARNAIQNHSENDASQIIGWLEEITKLMVHLERDPSSSPNRNEVYFSPNDHCVHRIQQLFNTAKISADVCVFTITDDRIRSEMIAAHKRGIEIRILSDDDKSGDLGSDVDFLKRQGLQVRFDQSSYHMHHKFAIFDRHILLTGSYNWTRSAAEHNEENFLITHDSKLRTEYQNEFNRLWKLYG